MYKDYFGLQESPFSISPDPRYLYLSDRHREALAHLVYGVQSDGGFIVLSGEVGTGKTTVCRCFLEQIPEDTDVAFILNPKLDAAELLAAICDDFVIDYPEGNESIKVFTDELNKYLLESHANGRNTVLIIDEAQNLSVDVLEQLRLLTNLETNEKKLLQIILLGQPELNVLLEHSDLRQLSQRITARYHLSKLTKTEIATYLKHRLSVAGFTQPLFTPKAINSLYKLTSGTPRLINVICERALIGAYAGNHRLIDEKIIKRAAFEVTGQRPQAFAMPSFLTPRFAVMTSVLSFFVAAVIWVVLSPQVYQPAIAWTENIYAELLSETVDEVETIPMTEVVHTRHEAYDQQSLSAWLRANKTGYVANGAAQHLFNMWGESGVFSKKDRPCLKITKISSLQCLANLSINDIQKLNRPAVITVKDDVGFAYNVLVKGVSDQVATLQLGDSELTTSLSALLINWSGRAYIFWRPAPVSIASIQLNEGGKAVDWLKQQLDLAEGVEDSHNTPVKFDQALIGRIKAFQASNGLHADGIAGTQTIINLNTINDRNVPLLTEVHSMSNNH